MKRENKDIANEHPFGKKVNPDRIELAEVTKFNFKDFNKYKQRVYYNGENVKKVFPDGVAPKVLERFRKLIEKN